MTRTTFRKLALLLLAAFVLRVAAGAWWQARVGPGFGFGDSLSYWSLGHALAAGEPYRYGAADSRIARAPGYPLLLAPLFLIGGDDPPILWARVLGATLGTLSVAGVWWLARRLFGTSAGWLAGLAAAFYPESVATSIFVLAEAPFCPLMLANLALWIAAWQTDSSRRAVWLAAAAGATASAATLVRPSWLLFLPFALGVGLLLGKNSPSEAARADPGPAEAKSRVAVAKRSDAPVSTASARRRHLLLGAAMAAGMVLVMTPWWLRNAQAVGCFVPTTLEVGASLYDGLNPHADGGSNMAFVDDSVRRESEHPSGSEDTPLEVRLDRRMRHEALTWAKANPSRVVQLAWVKFLRIWNIWPNEESLRARPVRLLIMLTYVPVVVLGILGAAQTVRRGWPYWLCWLPAVYFTLLHVVFVGSIRYRQPAVLGLIVLAAGWVAARRPSPSTTEG